MAGGRTVALGLLLACVLLFFPPVRSIRTPADTARTCLLATDIYRTEMREETSDGTRSWIETTSLDVPRLAVELSFLAAFAALLTIFARTSAEYLAKPNGPSAE